jgi:Nif-specific regulatory protein
MTSPLSEDLRSSRRGPPLPSGPEQEARLREAVSRQIPAQGAVWLEELERVLGSDGGLRQRLLRALALLEQHMAATRAVICAVNARTRQLEVVACRGLDARHYRPRFASGVVGRAAQSKQRIVVPQVCLDPMALSELTDAEAWQDPGWSLIALPLLSGPLRASKASLGVLSCYSRGETAPAGDMDELSAAARLFAGALERALLLEPLSEPEVGLDVDLNSGGGAGARAAVASGSRPEAIFEYANLVGASSAMRQVYEEIAQVARTNATTLIRGESGTGKELVACAIHHNSDRALQLLVKVNCAALPEPLFESELFGHERGAYTGAHARRRGRFELATQGTLFLDEIGELTPTLQAKLLRVLQSREFERVGGTETLRTNTRIIAATNRNLEELVKSGAFREDLYYRLNVFSIVVPPLRGRRADVCSLAEHFVTKYATLHRRAVTDISSRALDLLSEHGWPGNVRELENAVERAVVVCDGFVIGEQHLPPAIRLPASVAAATHSTLRDAVAALETKMLADALARAHGNCARAARELGVSERVVRYKASLYGIDLSSLRS